MASIWQIVDDGVMLYVPSDNAVNKTQKRLSRLSVSQEPELYRQDDDGKFMDYMLPKYRVCNEDEDLEASNKANAIEQHYDSRPTSPSTLSEESACVLYTPPSSPTESSPSSLSWEHIFQQQIESYASNIERFNRPTTTSDGTSLTNTNYESDGSDSLAYSDTPCPLRTKDTNRRKADKRTRVFKGTVGEKKSEPTICRLDWGKRQTKKPDDTSSPQLKRVNMLSPEKLKALEISPRHKQWTNTERALVTILYRWWEGISEIGSVFNHLTGLDLPARTINTQHNYIRLHGEKAFPFYGEIYSVPFHDPKGQYAAIKRRISDAADELGIRLLRRENDRIVRSSAAAHKSMRAQRHHQKLIKRAAKEKETQISLSSPSIRNVAQIRAGGCPMLIGQDFDETEFYVDAVETVPLTIAEEPVSSGSPSRGPHLAFRVWDDNSRTIWDSQHGFIAEAHSLWNPPFPSPPNPEQEGEKALLLFLSNLHLSKTGNASPFVSVATSLLQAINIASALSNNSYIACIDLDHPSLNAPNKKIKASNLLTELKDRNQAKWAKYKGQTEIMFWANVPKEAVISTFPLSVLKSLSLNFPDCGELLALDAFEPGARAKSVALKLRQRNYTLSNAAAEAMGRIGQVFGMDRPTVSLNIIRDFISRLVDGGWIIQAPEDSHTTKCKYAARFAIALGSRNLQLDLHSVMTAFLEGVAEGTRTLLRYTPRRSTLPRRRTA